MSHINLSKLVPYTSYYELSESIRALYRILDQDVKKCLNATFKCPKCGQITQQFAFYIQIFNNIQITININDCGECKIPLDLIQPPIFIIVYRAISEMQQNYQDIKQIPEKINYFTEDIVYDLHHVTTNDVVNDLYQNIIRDLSEKIYFNQNFEYNAEIFDLQEQLQFICKLNPYSNLLTVPNQSQEHYNFIKKDEMKKYLYDCSYGPIQRMVGKTELIFYQLRSFTKYVKFEGFSNKIDQQINDNSYQIVEAQSQQAQQNSSDLMLSAKEQRIIMEKQQQIIDQLKSNKFNIPVNNVPINNHQTSLYTHFTDNQLLRYHAKQQELIREFHNEKIFTPEYQNAREKLNKASLALQRKKIKYRGWQ